MVEQEEAINSLLSAWDVIFSKWLTSNEAKVIRGRKEKSREEFNSFVKNCPS